MRSHLPSDFRPKGLLHKIFRPGLDLPAWFYQDIKGIDESLYLVYHPVEVLYEDLMNQYTGLADDPRWNIHESFGQEIWGCPLTMPDGSPKWDETWHLWRLARDYGWTHVSNIASRDEAHLQRILDRLGKEKLYKQRYGALDWNKKLRADEEERQAKKQDAKDQQFLDIQTENKWFMRRAMENYDRGVYAPTRPTKDVIASYAGQTNRSKMTREITDKEGGLYLPEDKE